MIKTKTPVEIHTIQEYVEKITYQSLRFASKCCQIGYHKAD